MKMPAGALMRGFLLLETSGRECASMVNDVNYWPAEDGPLSMYCERVCVYIYVCVYNTGRHDITRCDTYFLWTLTV